MRISDWSSDVCSSDLARLIAVMMAALAAGIATQGQAEERRYMLDLPLDTLERALTKLSLQSSQQIIFSRDLLAGRTSTALRGLYSTDDRSEEHTSELQSLMRISYAVFCLNKKTTNN